MLINLKRVAKRRATKVIVWIVILLLLIGAVYLGYKYISKDNNGSSSGNNNLPETFSTNGSGTTQNINTPTSDTEKPPLPPE